MRAEIQLQSRQGPKIVGAAFLSQCMETSCTIEVTSSNVTFAICRKNISLSIYFAGLFASSLAVLLFLLCDRLRLALCLTDLYGDQVSAAYMDGVAAPIIAKAMGMEMRPAVATSRTGIVPKGFYSEEEEEEQTPEDWAPLEFQPRRLNDKYYTFQPNLDRPPNYGKGRISPCFSTFLTRNAPPFQVPCTAL